MGGQGGQRDMQGIPLIPLKNPCPYPVPATKPVPGYLVVPSLNLDQDPAVVHPLNDGPGEAPLACSPVPTRYPLHSPSHNHPEYLIHSWVLQGPEGLFLGRVSKQDG